MANLVRGGRLERVQPVFLLGILWRVDTTSACSMKAHERIRFLGRPGNGEKNPREEKVQEGHGFCSAFIIRAKIQTLIGIKPLK